MNITFGSFPKRTPIKGQHTPVNARQFKTRKIPTPFRSTESMWGFLYIRHQPSAISPPSSPLGETERGSLLLILILPPILLHHFQKLFKLLHPVRFHLPSIKNLPIRLQPIEHIMLLNPMLRRVPIIRLNKTHHLIIPRYPPFILRHIDRQIQVPIQEPCSIF